MIGNYSLADQLTGVGLTPLGEDVLNDPRAMQRMGNDLAGMSAYQPQSGVLLDAEPAGAVTGQQGASFFSATPEDDTNIVVKAIQTVLGAPFNLLRGAKEGLEEVIGHPYAAQREMQDDRAEMIASMLADSDKAMVGMPFDRGSINARQTNMSTVATGQATGIQPVLTPRKTGIVELFTGENRKRRAREMMALQEAMKLRGVQLDWGKTGAQTFQANTAGLSNLADAQYKTTQNQQLTQFGPDKWRGEITELASRAAENYAGATENYAQANQANAGAYANRARGDSTYSMIPFEQARLAAQARFTNERADTDAARRPGLVVKDTMSAARDAARLQKEVATGQNSPAVARAAADSASKLNAELAKVRKGPGYMFGLEAAEQRERDVYSSFGVPEIMDSQGKGTGQFDVEAWRKTLVPEKAESKSTDEIIAGILQSIEEMKRKFDTGEKATPTVAEPAMPEPTINPVSIDDYDKVIPQLGKGTEIRDFLIEKYGLGETQAREVARAIVARRGGR